MAHALVLHTSNRGSIPLRSTNVPLVKTDIIRVYETLVVGSTPTGNAKFTALSSNGIRALVFETSYHGSNPCRASKFQLKLFPYD